MVIYHNTQIEVLVGDYVEVKPDLLFWRGWQPGRVVYVPGISPLNPELEFNGLTWVAIQNNERGQTGHVVSPETHQLKKNVRFIRRANAPKKTPSP